MIQGHFRTLRIFIALFKVMAFLYPALMVVGLTGLFMAHRRDPGFLAPQLFQRAVMDMVMTGILSFLLFYALGEIIRILLAIEAQTRQDN